MHSFRRMQASGAMRHVHLRLAEPARALIVPFEPLKPLALKEPGALVPPDPVVVGGLIGDWPVLAVLPCQAWNDTFASLCAVIGSRGVTALYQRALWLCREDHPPLAALQDPLCSTMDQALAALRELLSRQSPAAAAATQAVLIHHFSEALSQLLGTALTERLLRPLLWPLWDGMNPQQECS